MTTDEYAARLLEIRERVAAAASRVGRNPDAVRIIGASKTVPADRLRDAVLAGVRDLGENRAQELVAKAPELADLQPTWHFIGALQRNKVGMCAPFVSVWHSVDRPELADAIAQRASGARVLLEVNTSGEPQKAGIAPSETEALVEHCRRGGLDVIGLMTVPAAEGDPRGAFAALRGLADRLGLPECSMGMTGDFEIAVEEGATMVRIGSALFGARPGTAPA